ncbi:hypothetical protein GGF31_001519, partial [Allomyces arbusculus]
SGCASRRANYTYQALGANLSGWDVFCKIGSRLRPPAAKKKERDAPPDIETQPVLTIVKGIDEDEDEMLRSSYPLFGQRTTAPLAAWARLAVFALMAGAYAAICFGSSTPHTVPWIPPSLVVRARWSRAGLNAL